MISRVGVGGTVTERDGISLLLEMSGEEVNGVVGFWEEISRCLLHTNQEIQ